MTERQSDKHSVVCHAPGDRCLGCDHYKGLTEKCSYAVPECGTTFDEWWDRHGRARYQGQAAHVAAKAAWMRALVATAPVSANETASSIADRFDSNAQKIDPHFGPVGVAVPISNAAPQVAGCQEPSLNGWAHARQLERELAERDDYERRLCSALGMMSVNPEEALNVIDGLMERAADAIGIRSASGNRPTAGAYRWIEDATKLLRFFVAFHTPGDMPKEFQGGQMAQRVEEANTLLSGVPCGQVDLGFDSPADRAARSTTQPIGNPLLWNVLCMHQQIDRGAEWQEQWRELLAAIDQHLTRTGFKRPERGEDQRAPVSASGKREG